MKKLTIILSVLFMAGLVYSQEIVNDAQAELRQAKNFHAISVSNAFDVYLSQGNEETVAVSASDPKYKEAIKVEVENGILKIYLARDESFWKRWGNNRMKLKAYVSFKTLDKLMVSGACDVIIHKTLQVDDFDLRLSGASNLSGKVEARKLSVELSGASDIKITGRANELNIHASGASEFKSSDFSTDYCKAEASGASSISFTVNKELSADASGASTIVYRGSGMIKDIRTSGASNVRKS
jgi:hypothetical protein